MNMLFLSEHSDQYGSAAYRRNDLKKTTALMLKRTPLSCNAVIGLLKAMFKFYTLEVMLDEENDTHWIEFEAFENSDNEKSITGKRTIKVGSIFTGNKEFLSKDEFLSLYMDLDELNSGAKYTARPDLPDDYKELIEKMAVNSGVARVDFREDRTKRLIGEYCDDMTEECFAFSDTIISMAEELKSIRSSK